MALRIPFILVFTLGVLLMKVQQVVCYFPSATTNYNPQVSVHGPPTLAYNPQEPSHASNYAQDEDCVRKMENYKKARRILGHRELEESHYIAPDQALIDLASDDEYEYRQTKLGNNRRSIRFSRNVHDWDMLNSTYGENEVMNEEPESIPNSQVVSQRYGGQPATDLPIKVDYYCNGDDLYWIETNPYNGKVLKYERRYDEEKKTMEYQVSADNLVLNHEFSSKPKKKGLAAAIAIPIAVGVPLGLLAIPVALGVVAFFVVSGGAIVATLASIFLGIGGLFRRKDQFRCPDRRLLFPCACSETIDAQGRCFLTITCPQGGSLQEIQQVFNRIPVRDNIDTIVLNLPAGANAIPANFLGNNRAKVLQLVGVTGTTQQNTITIDSGAFTATSGTTNTLIMRQFNFVNINWNFLTGFNVLNSIQIFNSVNVNTPPVLPTLPFLNQFLVDGVNKLSTAGRSS